MSIFLQEWDGKLLTVREHELDHVVVASDERVCGEERHTGTRDQNIERSVT